MNILCLLFADISVTFTEACGCVNTGLDNCTWDNLVHLTHTDRQACGRADRDTQLCIAYKQEQRHTRRLAGRKACRQTTRRAWIEIDRQGGNQLGMQGGWKVNAARKQIDIIYIEKVRETRRKMKTGRQVVREAKREVEKYKRMGRKAEVGDRKTREKTGT